MRAYLITLLVAAATTYLLLPIVRRMAIVGGVCAPVRDRDVHAEPTPRLGGVAMLGGFLAALLVGSELTLVREVFETSEDWRALISGAVVIVLLGVADDIWDLDAFTKLAGQVVAAGLMVTQGIQLLWVPVFFGGAEIIILPPSLGVLLTVLIVLVTVNAVNFVDGLDGLAAGIVAIAAVGFFLFSYLLSYDQGLDRAQTPTLISAILAGMCLGFLPHNFYPARIFMGDSGSMLLGLLLAASTISLTGRIQPAAIGGATLTPALLLLLLPLLVLVVPLADLLLAVVRRTRARRSPFAPDKQHLHHRLLEIGHSHRRAVVVMYAWSALLAFGVLTLTMLSNPVLYVLVAVVVVLAVLLTFRPRRTPALAGDGAAEPVNVPPTGPPVEPPTRAQP